MKRGKHANRPRVAVWLEHIHFFDGTPSPVLSTAASIVPRLIERDAGTIATLSWSFAALFIFFRPVFIRPPKNSILFSIHKLPVNYLSLVSLLTWYTVKKAPTILVVRIFRHQSGWKQSFCVDQNSLEIRRKQNTRCPNADKLTTLSRFCAVRGSERLTIYGIWFLLCRSCIWAGIAHGG